MAGRAFTEILARLESRGLQPRSIGPRRIEAFCPVHDDRRRPNLNLSDHTPGKATVHCWACGDGSGAWLKQFMDALGLLPRHVYDDAWSDGSKPDPRRDPGDDIADLDWTDELPRHPWIESAAEVYVYRRILDGPIVGVYLVWKGRKKKRAYVRPSRFGLVAGLAGGLYSWDGGQRVWRRTGKRPGRTFPTTRLPFYRGEFLSKLDELTDPVLWCAGQKDADTAARLGFPSIAHPGGEGACRPDLARQLAGRRVVIIFDYDATGRKMGPRLAERLRTYGVEARALDPAWMVRDLPEPVPEGFDLTEWSKIVPFNETQSIQRMVRTIP